jgi:putative ABC transport system permease protein
VFFGLAIVHALNLLGTSVVSTPYRTLVGIVVLAALGGILAAVRPAQRAGKLNILWAIASE